MGDWKMRDSKKRTYLRYQSVQEQFVRQMLHHERNSPTFLSNELSINPQTKSKIKLHGTTTTTTTTTTYLGFNFPF